jgi:hypothetical protein
VQAWVLVSQVPVAQSASAVQAAQSGAEPRLQVQLWVDSAQAPPGQSEFRAQPVVQTLPVQVPLWQSLAWVQAAHSAAPENGVPHAQVAKRPPLTHASPPQSSELAQNGNGGAQ